MPDRRPAVVARRREGPGERESAPTARLSWRSRPRAFEDEGAVMPTPSGEPSTREAATVGLALARNKVQLRGGESTGMVVVTRHVRRALMSLVLSRLDLALTCVKGLCPSVLRYAGQQMPRAPRRSAPPLPNPRRKSCRSRSGCSRPSRCPICHPSARRETCQPGWILRRRHFQAGAGTLHRSVKQHPLHRLGSRRTISPASQ